MEKIIIENLSKEWLRCVDVIDEYGMPCGSVQGIKIPPNDEIIVQEKNENFN